jgi:hypothetical protein
MNDKLLPSEMYTIANTNKKMQNLTIIMMKLMKALEGERKLIGERKFEKSIGEITCRK